MRNIIIGAALALAIITPSSDAAAASKPPKIAKCDGKHRRPANPHGSILPTVDPHSGTSTPAGETPAQEQGQEQSQEPGRAGVDVFPGNAPTAPKTEGSDEKPEPQVPPISSASPLTLFQSC